MPYLIGLGGKKHQSFKLGALHSVGGGFLPGRHHERGVFGNHRG